MIVYTIIFPKQSAAEEGFLLRFYSNYLSRPLFSKEGSGWQGRPEVGPSRPRAMPANDLLVGKVGPR